MSFDPTKPVMPTCGGEAIIHSTSGPFVTRTGVGMPIIASVRPPRYSWEVCYFRSDGGFCADGSKHRYDLINIPEEKWRDWTPEEVPVGALFKSATSPQWVATIIEVTHGSTPMLHAGFGRSWYFGGLKDTHLYSTDLGKTWQPAGVKIQ